MEKYFITGSPYFVEKKIETVTVQYEDANIETFFADELNKQEFMEYINSVDLFGNVKIAVLRNTEKLKDIKQFIESTSKCTETILILTAVIKDKPYKDLTNNFRSSSFKIFEEENKKASKFDVVNVFKNKGITLNVYQADTVLEKCLYNLNMVENEADKIYIYSDAVKRTLSSNEVLEHISGSKEENIYNLTDAYGMRNTAKAVQIYKSIPSNDDNDFKIFFSLIKRVSYLYLAFIDKSLIKVYDSQQKKIIEQKAKWKKSELVKVIDFLSDLDKDIKTGIRTINNSVLMAILSSKKYN